LEIDSEKVDKSIFDKRKMDNNAIDYRLPIASSNPEITHLDMGLFYL